MMELKEHTEMTAEEVRPVRTVRLAVMNLLYLLILLLIQFKEIWFGTKGRGTFQSSRYPRRWSSSALL